MRQFVKEVDPEEYNSIFNVEKRHWYNRGKREIVRHWLDKAGALRKEASLLDCGAGSGFFAMECNHRCRALAMDHHPVALERMRELLPADQVIKGSAESIPLEAASVDAVTALDVLEHVKEDARAAAEIRRVLKPGGLLVATVPALMSLWSDWDVSLGHYRRYHHKELLQLFSGGGWDIAHWNYLNVAALPAIYLIRKWRAIKAGGGTRPPPAGQRAEEQLLPAFINQLLYWAFVWPGCQPWIRFPCGVSLLLAARKKH